MLLPLDLLEFWREKGGREGGERREEERGLLKQAEPNIKLSGRIYLRWLVGVSCEPPEC